MKNFNKQKIVIGLVAIAFIIGIASYVRAATFVDLLTADNFAVLAGSAITNTGATTITGDIGTFPTLTETGFGSITQIGINHVGDVVTQTAKNDLVTAYGAAAGQALDTAIVADLGGQTLTTGVYNTASSIALTGPLPLILDGGGNPNAVFIFQAGSTLVTGANSSISLINGAQACNVFWQVGSSATLGTGSNFFGNILAMSSITDDGGSTINGRLLARNFAVTLNNTTISKATCSGVAQGTLHILKHVVNDNTGSSVAADFTMNVSGTTNISSSSFVGSEAGTTITLDAGSYVVDEGAHAGYTKTLSSDCSGTITSGGDKTCTITNNDIIPVVHHSSGGGGYLAPVVNTPLIGITKVASPLSLPMIYGIATYNYTVWNVGKILALTNISVVDDKCSAVNYISGDLNGNGKLDINESWNYFCKSILLKTTTNTATASGYGDDTYRKFTSASAIATVVVSNVVVPKLPKTGFAPKGMN